MPFFMGDRHMRPETAQQKVTGAGVVGEFIKVAKVLGKAWGVDAAAPLPPCLVRVAEPLGEEAAAPARTVRARLLTEEEHTMRTTARDAEAAKKAGAAARKKQRAEAAEATAQQQQQMAEVMREAEEAAMMGGVTC